MTDLIPVDSLRPRIPVNEDVAHAAAVFIARQGFEHAVTRELWAILDITPTPKEN